MFLFIFSIKIVQIKQLHSSSTLLTYSVTVANSIHVFCSSSFGNAWRMKDSFSLFLLSTLLLIKSLNCKCWHPTEQMSSVEEHWCQTALSFYLNLSEGESKGSRSEPPTETKTLAPTVSGLMLSVRATALSFAHHLDVAGLPLVLCVFLGEWNKSKTQCSRDRTKDTSLKYQLQITDHANRLPDGL